jgi:DNA-binding NtrC family response regulator
MLLRAIDLGEVRALGEDQAQQVKVRVIAATNRDLEVEMREGRFRQDLFYRLAVVRLQVTPLRERVEDIEPLAQHFAVQAGLPPLDAATIADLGSRSWPGNARELRNALLSFAALGDLPQRPSVGDASLEQILAPLVDLDQPFSDQKELIVDSFTRRYLAALMQQARGNQSEAARISGLNRTYLGRMLSKYGFDAGRKANRER